MIIIVTEESDISAFKVVQYLKKMDTPYFIISESRHLSEIKDQFLADPGKFVVWMRRMNYRFGGGTHEIFNAEITKLNRFYLHLFEKKSFSCFGTILGEYDHNKLIDLYSAKEIGIKVPETAIVSTRKELEAFSDEHQIIITKPISNVIRKRINAHEVVVYGMTSFIELKDAKPDFTPSLVQRFIPGNMEVRVFYFDQDFFSIAMIKEDQYVADIKDTRLENNRTLNIVLPKKLKKQLLKLTQQLQVNTCSFDFLIDNDGDFVFLEMNRCGQFDWVSVKGNYGIEEKIAERLTEEYRAIVL